jgi:hypothetical protein
MKNKGEEKKERRILQMVLSALEKYSRVTRVRVTVAVARSGQAGTCTMRFTGNARVLGATTLRWE